MSALELYRVKSTASTGTCTEEGCPNKGRYQIFLIGQMCLSRLGTPELLCEKHGKKWAADFKILAPSERRVLRALRDLGRPAPKSLDAVELLRALGLSAEHVARAVKETKDGKGAEEILEELGADERVGVAA